MEKAVEGRAKGGLARASALTTEQRKEIARQAAAVRWGAIGTPVALYGSSDRPLRIGVLEIPCYVLDDDRRVITQRGMMAALGISQGSAGRTNAQGDRLTRFLTGAVLSPFVSNDLLSLIQKPLLFQVKVHHAGMRRANGYEATALPDICEAVLKARAAGKLHGSQKHIADRCELLVRGFSRVGIVALIDEATGYQTGRARDALAQILEAFIAKELQPYVSTFPKDYYEEMFRLRSVKFPAGSVKRPQYFGMLTNEVVYRRIAPGVLDELKRLKQEVGKSRDKLFQRLTSNIGYPKLREHLGAVTAVMKLSSDWHDFMAKLNRLYPRYEGSTQLAFEYSSADDDGKGI